MKFPIHLKENGTIAFIAPSFGCSDDPTKGNLIKAQENLNNLGFKIILGPNCFLNKGIGISNTPQKCAEELTSFYTSDDNDCIISCSGGELMCEILDYVDFDKIKQSKPKWYMGYSDNSNFTFLLTTIADVASIYGPCAPVFGMRPYHDSLNDSLNILTGKKHKLKGYPMWQLKMAENLEPCQPFNLTEKTVIKYYLPDGTSNIDNENNNKNADINFSGRLIGGCLDTLIVLLGTKYDHVSEFSERYKSDGIVWFLESCEITIIATRRLLWQMEHAGWFKNCKGFLIGRPFENVYNNQFGISHYQAYLEVLKKFNVPVIFDVDIGHHPPTMPLICGSYANVTSDGKTYEVEMIEK